MTNDWEARYLANDMPWEKGAPSPGLVEFLREHPMDGRILVPGCGWGHDVRAIAAANPTAEVIGIDIAPSALEGARRFERVGRESYALANLFDLPLEFRGTFDGVWEHTCFCAINPADRDRYVEGVLSALKTGGAFVAIFYVNPDVAPGEGPPFASPQEELDEKFGAVLELVREWQPSASYPGREGREWMRHYLRR